MISRYQLGYISNLTAKFYKNPAAGTILHESLVPKDYSSDFLSAYGNTSGVFEPSEFFNGFGKINCSWISMIGQGSVLTGTV